MKTKTDELVHFWRKLNKLIDSGIPLLHALNVIGQETTDQELKGIIEDIDVTIKSGGTLKDAIAKYPAHFPASIQVMVNAGEIHGTLEETCLKIAEALEDGTFQIGKTPECKETKEIAIEEAPIIKLVNKIIDDAHKSRASDIHLEWARGKLQIRYRIDGVLKVIGEPIPAELGKALIGGIKVMMDADVDVAERRLPQDGRIRINIEGNELDFRVDIVPYVTGESIVLRLLPRQDLVNLDLDKMGFTDNNLSRLREWSKRPNGVIIVTGPTGCGKTTVLYALLKELNTEGVKIATVEDPVEYQIDGINQLRINPRVGLTFSHAMRSLLRQAPDIIMVGEIRDQETAYMIVRAALAGHLILTTLHTNDAPAAISRLHDIGLEPFLINSSLIGILSQRLVRMICPNCKEEYQPEEWKLQLFDKSERISLFRGKGCDQCHHFGYRGRTAIHEMLEIDDKLRQVIARDTVAGAIRQQALASGMITLRQDGMAKIQQGITTIEEVLSVSPV